MFTQNEINRMMFNNQQQQFSRMSHNDMNHVHPNMSKFFDFHKQRINMMNSSPMTDQLNNMANLMDHRMNPNFVESQNGNFYLF
jgi:hypothetical protein